ncbi:hypothetical protein HUU40_02320 [candidate division KSB1 bacterium]|nr:hypothetical protein [candidate division KSB1 bacterium]
MRIFYYWRRVATMMSMLGLLAMVVGCSNDLAPGPMSPVTSSSNDNTLLAKPGGGETISSITPLPRKTRSVNGYGGISSKIIASSSGGSLSYAGHTMQVPKYAFSEQQKEFYIADVNSDWIQADYGPNGWFLEPVKITISYADADLRNVDLKKLTIAWYSETLGMWVDVGGTVDRANQTISVYVWHFTQYTISTR